MSESSELHGVGHAVASKPLVPAKIGMVCFLASEAAFFSTLIMAYVIFLRHVGDGPTPANTLSLGLVLVNTLALILSSFTLHFAEKAKHAGRHGTFQLLWTVTILLGLAFLGGTAYEWKGLIQQHGLTIGRNMFGTTFYTLVGFHAFHVTLGVIGLIVVLLVTMKHNVSMPVTLVGWYWHFVDVVWVIVFLVVYVVGR
ncbi:hypothetical protein BH11PLA2_BH11PLA2_16700 [soil metagenome]